MLQSHRRRLQQSGVSSAELPDASNPAMAQWLQDSAKYSWRFAKGSCFEDYPGFIAKDITGEVLTPLKAVLSPCFAWPVGVAWPPTPDTLGEAVYDKQCNKSRLHAHPGWVSCSRGSAVSQRLAEPLQPAADSVPGCDGVGPLLSAAVLCCAVQTLCA